ncbi:phage portal protein [Sphingomonas aerolata]|uniref:phage portal protein n=1 Tax=Sphingomonas aerolata TaxID=185951 RepID=UPI00334FE019
MPIVRESFSGAWQQNVEVNQTAVLAFHAVFSCMTLIASDISKLRVKLVSQDTHGIWAETTRPAYSPVLRKPNSFQTRIQFFESWFLSKLSSGNTYVLKRRDARNVVIALYVLDPHRVKPLVADDGSIFYELQQDDISEIAGPMVVPAREIIHDRFNCLFHPLVGVSPIYANGLAATQGLRIQDNSAVFFGNQSRPGGLLSAPGKISKESSEELKANWYDYYGGKNSGRVAVLGDGLKYEHMAVTAKDAELIDQLKWTAEVVCSTFHVPPYKLGIGNLPTNSNVESLNLEYYTQALQSLIEAAELCLDDEAERLGAMQRSYNDSLTFTADQWDIIAGKVQSAGQGMADAFGEAGRAIGDMASIYASYQADRTRAEAEHLAAIKAAGADQSQISRENARFALRSSGAQVQAFGDATSAAKGWRGGGSSGSSAMQEVPKGASLIIVPAAALRGPVVDLAVIGAYLMARVDLEAERVRLRFVTGGAGQAMTYTRKEAEARAWVAQPGTPTPFLDAEAEATGATRESVAAVVIAQADAWVQVGSAIEGLRMGAKAGIDRATTLGAIVAAAAVDWSAFGG